MQRGLLVQANRDRRTSMENVPRPFSPQYVPQPLSPSPFRTRSFAPERTATPAVIPERSGGPQYLSTVCQPKEDPYTIIHDYYNVSPASFSLGPDGSVPRTIEMSVVCVSGTLPTHVLAVLDSARQSSSSKTIRSRGRDTLSSAQTHPGPRPTPTVPAPSLDAPQALDRYLMPIDAEAFFLSFGHDAARTLGATALATKWSKAPSPHIRADRATGARLITLPVFPLYVPHPPSLPHILLFAQNIPIPTTFHPGNPSSPPSPLQRVSGAPGSSASALAAYLLPLAAIEEFPSAPAMAAAAACQCAAESLASRAAFNEGIWRNVLALSPADAALVDLVRVARNVTSDAVRLQQQRATSVWLSAPPARGRPVAKVSRNGKRGSAKEANDRERHKVSHLSVTICPPATAISTIPTDISPPPRLPIIEVDYPVDVLVKPAADTQRAIPVGESLERRHSAQLERLGGWV